MPPVASDHMETQFIHSITNLDEETRGVLMWVLHAGCIFDGVESFVEGGESVSGRDNGMFYCFLGINNEMAPLGCSRDHTGPSWSDGRPRHLFTERLFIACTKARIPLVIEGDAPAVSPMATAMTFAQRKGATYLGYVGKKSGSSTLKLDTDLTYNWDHANVSARQLRDTLKGGTFTIDNTEVRSG